MKHSVVRFLRKRLSDKDIMKKYFLFTVHNRVKKPSQGCPNVADDEMKLRKWLRQQSKDFCAAGFDALLKRWNKCTIVGGGYVEK
jgi:hypothetical protein